MRYECFSCVTNGRNDFSKASRALRQCPGGAGYGASRRIEALSPLLLHSVTACLLTAAGPHARIRAGPCVKACAANCPHPIAKPFGACLIGDKHRVPGYECDNVGVTGSACMPTAKTLAERGHDSVFATSFEHATRHAIGPG